MRNLLLRSSGPWRPAAVLRAALLVLASGPAAAGVQGDACASSLPPGAAVSAKAVFEVGACLVSARRMDEARAWFAAHPAAQSDPLWGAAIAGEQGQLEAALGAVAEARRRFAQARGSGDAGVAAAAALNLARIAPDESRLAALEQAARALALLSPERRVPLLLALGEQARGMGTAGQALALAALDEARRLAAANGQPREQALALDALAQLYEDRNRPADALRLSDAGVLAAGRLGGDDLLMPLEWRRGRLLRAAGERAAALAAFERAADHLERIRKDIPVTYADGRSSFRETFAPVYQGLAELLLDQAPAAERQRALRRARRAVERLKQSEFEDYLGDRCVVQTEIDRVANGLPAGTAVLYPVMLPDRLELLVERTSGIERLTVEVGAQVLAEVARRFAGDLRGRGWTDTDAEILHAWLLKPVEALMGGTLDTLIVVPDGSLRLFPFASLRHEGRYAIQDYAIAVVPGLSITHLARASASTPRALLAGLSLPGEVVTKLPAEVLRSLEPAGAAADAGRSARLQQILALPGVEQEIDALSRLGEGKVLLNEAFSVSAFERELGSGEFNVVHIASHGVFGGSAQSTFLMAHNDIITMERLQQLLDQPEAGPGIELLTLSACETAEGNDRAPLGLAGAALRARAGAALGSLWPVADDATRVLMERFYAALRGGASKVQALRTAQLAVLADERFAHPFYWAPFILVGDWH